jgi:hypothetical protein
MFTGALLSLSGLFLYVLNVVLIRYYLTRSRPFLLELEARLPPPAKEQEYLWEKTAGTGVVPKWVSALGLLAIPVFGLGVLWLAIDFVRWFL